MAPAGEYIATYPICLVACSLLKVVFTLLLTHRSNHWLKLHINLPKEWRDKEWVELEFDPSCEVSRLSSVAGAPPLTKLRSPPRQAMIFDEHGLSLQGITGGFDKRRVDFPLPKSMRKGVLLYAEVTCNGLFGVENRQEGDPDPDRYFELRSADIVVKRPEAWHLLWDFQLLQGCVNEMPRDGPLQNKASKDEWECVSRCCC